MAERPYSERPAARPADNQQPSSLSSAGPSQPPPPSRRSGRGCLIFAVIAVVLVGLIIGCTTLLSSNASDDPGTYNGCSKALPPDDFHDCIYRQGIWQGVQ